MRGERDETVMLIFSESSKLAQTECKKRHDKVASVFHWEVCSKYGLKLAKHCYEHRVEEVIKNQGTQILKKIKIRNDCVIEARSSCIVLINNMNQETFAIYMTTYSEISVRETRRLNFCQNTKILHWR